MGCEILTLAMCCGDTRGFSPRGRLGARERRAAEPWPLPSRSLESMAHAGRGGFCFAVFGADEELTPFHWLLPSSFLSLQRSKSHHFLNLAGEV